MVRLKNNTKQQSKIGAVVIIDPNDPNSFIYASADPTNILGICQESVNYRSEASIATSGEALVYVSSNVKKGDIVRSRKSTDTISQGTCKVAKSGDAPYLQVGIARETGIGLINCHLNIYYFGSGVNTTINDQNIDGGSAGTIYLINQVLDGGNA